MSELRSDYIVDQPIIQREGTCNTGHNSPRVILPHIFDSSKTNTTEEKVLKEIGMSLSNFETLRGLFNNFNGGIKEMNKKLEQNPEI
jgi:hypothetical protein